VAPTPNWAIAGCFWWDGRIRVTPHPIGSFDKLTPGLRRRRHRWFYPGVRLGRAGIRQLPRGPGADRLYDIRRVGAAGYTGSFAVAGESDDPRWRATLERIAPVRRCNCRMWIVAFAGNREGSGIPAAPTRRMSYRRSAPGPPR